MEIAEIYNDVSLYSSVKFTSEIGSSSINLDSTTSISDNEHDLIINTEHPPPRTSPSTTPHTTPF